MAAAQVMQPQLQPPLSTAQQQPPLLPAGASADSTSSLHSSTPKPKPKPRDEAAAASASSSSSSSSSAATPVNATANNSGYRSFFNFFHSPSSSLQPPPPPLSSSPPSIHPHPPPPPPVLSQEPESIQVDAHAVGIAAHTQSAIRAAAPTMSAVSEDEVSPTRPQRGAGGATSSPGEGSGSPKAFSDYDENRSVSGVGNTTHGSGFLHPDERRKKRRKPSPPELLVIVRPPPSSKDRNPLNLQIQLVLPQAPPAGGQARTSGESSRDATTMKQPELRRRGSTSSSRSGRSEVTTASSSSYGGGGSSSSSNRRVTPLYNLSIHSILPTTISDAGTDQRVAKYSKKGVEIDGFGVLEPSELLLGINDLATLEASGVNGSGSGYGAAISPGVVSPARASNDGIGEPTSDPGVEPVVEEPPTSFDSMTPEAQSPDSHLGAKLMRRFKGFSLNLGKGADAPATTSGAAGSIAPSTSSNSLKPSISTFLSTLGGPKSAGLVKPATLASPEGATAGGAAASVPLSARPLSTSGLSVVTAGTSSHDVAQMTPGGGLSESGRRTQGYYWTVKRYTRRVTDSEGHSPRVPLGADGQNPVLKNVWRRFNSVNRLGGDERHPHPSEIPLRFEWTREGRSNSNSLSAGALDARAAKRLSTGSASAGGGGGDRVGRRASLRPPTARKTSSSQGHGRAVSTGRAGAGRSQSSSARGSLEHNGNGRDSSALDDGAGDDDDSGDLSDPEDSETPWSCHLVLGASTRIPIGTLSPAPHHPKLVAQLAVPFPLPDLSQTGLGADGAGLTREEIKDVICVTCLHLVIRESFGGLGRVRRRGDRV